MDNGPTGLERQEYHLRTVPHPSPQSGRSWKSQGLTTYLVRKPPTPTFSDDPFSSVDCLFVPRT